MFREEENPQAKLIANARNDRLFEDRADVEQLAKEVRYVIGGQEEISQASRVVVLPERWASSPWESVADGDRPSTWDDRLPLLVLPASPDEMGPTLGPWLRDHLQSRRNAVRFLLPRAGSTDLFRDRDLLILSRAVVLADRWRTQAPEYRRLQVKYERELRDILNKRFDRFAILDSWDYRDPTRCTFHVESHRAQGAKIPNAVDEHIRTNLFIPEDFEALVRAAAQNNDSVGKLLRELQEPRPASECCIPWLGETPMKERVIRLCAQGDIAINVRDMEHLQILAGETEDDAWRRMRGKLGTGKHLDETYIMRPQPAPHTTRGPGPVPPRPPDSLFERPHEGRKRPDGSDENKHGGPSPEPPPTPGSIFGGASELVPHASEATSPLNLLGKVESWGIGPGSHVQEIALKVSSMTGAQLDKLLKALPEGITYELRLQKEKK